VFSSLSEQSTKYGGLVVYINCDVL